MPISQKEYVDITSRVGGTPTATRRDLVLRLFTQSTLVGDDVQELSSMSAVGTLFGTDSDEYAAAKAYFGYVSPRLTSPRKLQFGRDGAQATTAQVIGYTPRSVSDIVSSGQTTFGISYQETGQSLTFALVENLVITGLSSYSAIAAAMQTAIRARFSSETLKSLKNANVTYDSTRGVFVFTGEPGEAVTVSFQTSPSVFTEAVGLYGRQNGGQATVISGAPTTASPVESVEPSIELSNNFGSFAFLATLTLDQHLTIAQANADRGVEYEYLIPVTAANYEAWSAALLNIGGCSLVLVGDANTEHDEVMPAAIKAATDYDARSGAVSYMYRSNDQLTAKVKATDLSKALNAARVNYYGQTQSAGRNLAFYQRGVMMGGSTWPVDQNIYANEQWLKDAVAVDLLSHQMEVNRISANSDGLASVINVIQAVIEEATNNGVISVGKELTKSQKLFVTEMTGLENAWQQVQNIGYVLNAAIESYTTDDGRTEYKIVYTLIYSKDDTIRKVEGLHALV